MDSFENNVDRALTAIAIEESLLTIGKDIHDTVADLLLRDYNCYFTDCYNHPEYLKRILKDHFGNSYEQIIIDIEKKLEKFNREKQLRGFLEILSRE